MPKEYIYSNQRLRPTSDPDLVYTQVAWGVRDSATLRVYPVVEPGEDRPEVLTVYLGRKQINDLIRVLRRARDQAYGRDE